MIRKTDLVVDDAGDAAIVVDGIQRRKMEQDGLVTVWRQNTRQQINLKDAFSAVYLELIFKNNELALTDTHFTFCLLQ